jgi:hypothetical protein
MSNGNRSKYLQNKINGELVGSNIKEMKKKKEMAGPASSKKPNVSGNASGIAFGYRIYVKIDVPQRPVRERFKAAELSPSEDTSLSAKLSTYK